MTSSRPCVLGVNFGHDGGAALLTPDRMVAIGEERLNRRRYSPGWLNAVLYCLRAAGLALADVDLVVASSYGRTPAIPADTGFDLLGIPMERITTVDHHLSHAYTAFCLSPYQRATILVADGGGNNTDTETFYVADSDGITRLGGNDTGRPRAGGIGPTYEAFTEYLGWSPQEAGKTMALASYGDPHAYTVPLFDLHGTQVCGQLTSTHATGVADLAARTNSDFGPPGSKGHDQRGINAAAYLQHHTEQILTELAEKVIAATGVGNLCLAGGVALNCVANNRLRHLPSVTGLFIPPPASDRGQALGCALYGLYRLTGELPRRALTDDSFGRAYDDYEIELALKRDPRSGLVERTVAPFTWRRDNDIAATAAQLLADGKLIGWFQGGSELGPRALGHRSILADPRSTQARDALNHRIKHREPFRPFAPAILEADSPDWFDLAGTQSPFMLLAPTVQPQHTKLIPGVVHIDGTARVQTVDPHTNPPFASLIDNFSAITGVPVVLNTSFNDREPIVETPADALATFQDTDLDALCIGGYLVEKLR
ncbi:carbamoyltransferase family protein [Actinomadura opuntiae]|uniref:carbamoyltransferase family protein n=1 Tax=Actinomadura sp. OS1-43 TaxID=604315 RepID=UPI00255B1D86|nr:carbamoyltransferase C-terminal domain-containing protein [Actinomadura sp. OS1-43]MDL4813069.1 carbamoyltransferase C-terminal domain-containing protein [Actinomadura sp. OS1-43]